MASLIEEKYLNFKQELDKSEQSILKQIEKDKIIDGSKINNPSEALKGSVLYSPNLTPIEKEGNLNNLGDQNYNQTVQQFLEEEDRSKELDKENTLKQVEIDKVNKLQQEKEVSQNLSIQQKYINSVNSLNEQEKKILKEIEKDKIIDGSKINNPSEALKSSVLYTPNLTPIQKGVNLTVLGEENSNQKIQKYLKEEREEKPVNRKTTKSLGVSKGIEKAGKLAKTQFGSIFNNM